MQCCCVSAVLYSFPLWCTSASGKDLLVKGIEFLLFFCLPCTWFLCPLPWLADEDSDSPVHRENSEGCLQNPERSPWDSFVWSCATQRSAWRCHPLTTTCCFDASGNQTLHSEQATQSHPGDIVRSPSSSLPASSLADRFTALATP